MFLSLIAVSSLLFVVGVVIASPVLFTVGALLAVLTPLSIK